MIPRTFKQTIVNVFKINLFFCAQFTVRQRVAVRFSHFIQGRAWSQSSLRSLFFLFLFLLRAVSCYFGYFLLSRILLPWGYRFVFHLFGFCSDPYTVFLSSSVVDWFLLWCFVDVISGQIPQPRYMPSHVRHLIFPLPVCRTMNTAFDVTPLLTIFSSNGAPTPYSPSSQ